MIPGSDRENTTVMGACNAAGRDLPPMVIFEGLQVQSTWRPKVKPDAAYYPWIFSNKSGWMNSETFYKWFEKFEEETRVYKKVCIYIEKACYYANILTGNYGNNFRYLHLDYLYRYRTHRS